MKNKILLIDADADFLDVTKKLFETQGYDVLTALNGQVGFARAKTESPDLIITEMILGYENEGAELAKAIAADAAVRNIPVVMVTSADKIKSFPHDIVPNEKDLPVKMVIKKPVSAEQLLDVAVKFIEKTGKKHRTLVGGIDTIANKWKGKKGNLIMVLHEIQNTYGYVPRDVAFELSRALDVPLTRIYEVITFYNYFKLEPPGKHIISVCMGTACYLKGNPIVLDELKHVLNIEESQTTKDGMFHLQIVRCLGCCGLAPVLMVDQKIYGKVKKSDITSILSEYTNKEKGVKDAINV